MENASFKIITVVFWELYGSEWMAFAVAALDPVGGTASINFCCMVNACSKAQLTGPHFSLAKCHDFTPLSCWLDTYPSYHFRGNHRWALIHACISLCGILLVFSGSLDWQTLAQEYAMDGCTDRNGAFPSPAMPVQANQSHPQGSRVRRQLYPHGHWQNEDVLPRNVHNHIPVVHTSHVLAVCFDAGVLCSAHTCLVSSMGTEDVLQFKGFGCINTLADVDEQHHD